MKGRTIETRYELQSVETYEGETIETKIARIVEQKEPITDGVALIYTEKKDGVMKGYDIRTDRWEVAIEAMDKVNKSKIAKGNGIEIKEKEEIGKDVPNKIGESPSEN